MNEIKFKTYEFKGKGLDLSDHTNDALIYQIDATKMIISTPSYPPHRVGYSKKKRFWSEIKTRLSHAWYALKGGECE